MLYNNHPHFTGVQLEPERKFELYADELDALAKFAAQTDKKEMANVLRQLAQYGRAKAQQSRGPVHFVYK